MSAFAASVNVMFRDPNLSAAAVYSPRGGPDVTLRALRGSRGHTASPLFEVGLSAPADTAEVRVADVAEPREGDTITFADGAFTVSKAEYDSERLTWRLDLEEAA